MRVVTEEIPLTSPSLGAAEEQAVLEVLRSGWLVQGERVAQFEQRVADYCGATHAVATTSCTTALQLALDGFALRPTDEVIVPSFTFVASVNAVIHAGATPRLVDVDPDTWNIDVAAALRAVNRKTRAVMPVDQFGLAADIPDVTLLARSHGLRVVEDAAPAIGAKIHGHPVGGLSEVTCLSFHPRKTVTSAEGGMLLTNSDEIAQRARMMRSHAASLSDFARHQAARVNMETYEDAGFNFRMSDVHAAIGLAQMERVDTMIARRRELAQRYDEAFAPLESVELPKAKPGYYHTYQTYCIVLTDAAPRSRDATMALLKERGITSRRGCMAVHLEPYFVERYGLPRLPVAERLAARSIAIPLFPDMRPDQQTRVIEIVWDLLR